MRRAVVLLAILALAGCASLGYMSTTVSYDRKALGLLENQLVFEYAHIEGYLTALCEVKQIPAERCVQAATKGAEMRKLYATWKASETTAKTLTPEQLAMLRSLGGQLLALAGRAGLMSTGLGGLGGLLSP